ncbi:MAG TPA: alpha/beta hydrolase [Acidimicrobiia bacterium]|nr:alpha/beta hydrolase [Acidimicrobiia bacterium]
MDHIELSDGRRLDIRVTGPEDGPVLVFHHGTPGSASGYRIVEEPAHERGLRMVWMSRPGYGDSSRRPGRSVVDVVSDTAEVLDALGVHTCLVGGGSSGGPHALACAARLDAAQAVLVVSSHAPFDAEGLDYLAGMGDANLAVYGAALDGEETLREYLEADRERLLGVSVEGFIEAWSSLLPEVDQAVLTDEFGEDVIADLQEALRTGVDGSVDDLLAFVKPWGFDLEEITTPTIIWHSSEDLLNPFAHGQWLASHVPEASSNLLEGEGHLSTWQAAPAMLDELLASIHDRTR